MFKPQQISQGVCMKMNLRTYLASINMTITDFADLVECHRSHLSRIICENKTVTRRFSRVVEQMTDGAVTLPYRSKEDKDKKTTQQ